MSSVLAAFFDEFNLRARAYPALLLLVPALAAIILLWPSAPLMRLVPLAVGVGGLYLLVDLVRGAGQALEKRLDDQWQGLPAQRALRLTGSEKSALVTRRRKLVEGLLSRRLPTAATEKRNPARAREAYDLAIRDLIPLVRGKDSDMLLHEENVRYSFRRNMLAIRGYGFGVASCCVGLGAVAFWNGHERGEATATVLVAATMLGIWWIVVRPSWVRQAGETYSRRFYDALQAYSVTVGKGDTSGT